MDDSSVRVIYKGGYVPDLAIATDPDMSHQGWLLYRHPDGQWVSLADLTKHIDVISAARDEQEAK